MRFTRVLAICFLAMVCSAIAEDKPAATPTAKKAGSSDAAYIATALSAAPAAISKDAGIMDTTAQTSSVRNPIFDRSVRINRQRRRFSIPSR